MIFITKISLLYKTWIYCHYFCFGHI